VQQALVTAFEPFGGETVNASLEAVRRLPARIATIGIATRILPTSFARAPAALERAIANVKPDIVLCVGLAADRAALCVERIAVNLQDARIADNDGATPTDLPVIPGAPAAYFSTLPVKDAVAALHAVGLAAEVSNSAGTFVCNHVFYSLMHLVASHNRPMCAGLLHVPRVRRLGDDVPAMAIEDIVRGIVIVLETAASGRDSRTRTSSA
jgi:pyroglutamyl-peptidase